MSQFTNVLALYLLEDREGRPVLRDGRCQWQLSREIKYDVGTEFSGETITIPTSFVTDLASIPFPARGLLPPDGPWAKAAVLHDALYASQGTCVFSGYSYRSREAPYTREESDKILREAMGVLGVPTGKQALIYRAVRAFGGRGWGS